MVPKLSSIIDTLPDYSLAPEDVPLIGSLVLQDDERDRLKSRIAESLQRQGMALVAHYYVDGDIQDLAEQTGGCVSDSLEMARFGRDLPCGATGGGGGSLYGRNSKNSIAGKAHIHAHAQGRVLAGFRLPA